MPGSFVVRQATEQDAPGMLAIYEPVVRHSHTSFELVPPTLDEFAARITGSGPAYPWLVAVEAEQVIGYAYAARHRVRHAYQWSAEVSVYTALRARGRGVATSLYTELFERLRSLGFVSLFAGIALPNPASVGLHEEVGFTHVGTLPNAGHKLGEWRDVGWWHLQLRTPPERPEEIPG